MKLDNVKQANPKYHGSSFFCCKTFMTYTTYRAHPSFGAVPGSAQVYFEPEMKCVALSSASKLPSGKNSKNSNE